MDRDYRIYSSWQITKAPGNEVMRALLERCKGSSPAVEIQPLKQSDDIPILVDIDMLRGGLFG